MKSLLKSVGLLLSISFVLSSFLWYLTNITWYLLVPLTIILQVLCWYIYQGILVTWYGIEARKYETEALKELSYQTVDITCPCSIKNRQNILLRLNENTQYQCNHCQKKVNVIVDISSVLATEPAKTDIQAFEALLEEAKKKIKE